MQNQDIYLPSFLAFFIAVFFSFRVRQSIALTDRYMLDGKFHFKSFWTDMFLYIVLALVGYGFIIVIFEFTPFLKPYAAYRDICAFVFGVISENGLPLLLDSVFALFRKKVTEIVDKS